MISISVQDLTKYYNTKVIFEGLSFQKNKGIVGISGPNGSGKSTLLKCMAYLLRPKRGTVDYYENDSLLDKEDVKNRIGYVAPYINLYEELTVMENARFISELTGTDLTDQSLKQLLKDLQLSELMSKPFGKLSTGQQQRTKIAVAMIRKPAILMLDEPGSNLDISGLTMLNELILKTKEKGALVILASNDERELSICDHIIDLRQMEPLN
ncbi:ATP-binding cassette domain-containing protein [Balneola sp. MJW-20]|uniref:ABC transporter ATP-binding protein n=1 Tax=Gracilimonas aurantiaca TaxID=3234185 RepID=UPI003465D35D